MALITAAQARLLQPGLSSTGADTDLDTIIGRVDGIFAEWCGYPAATAGGAPTMEDASYTLYNGRGGKVDVVDSRTLQLGVWPVTAITSIYDDTTEAYGTAVTSTLYTLIDGNAGLIQYNANAGRAWLNPGTALVRNIKVVAVCGWVTPPGPLMHAVAMMTKHIWDLRHTQGKTSVNAGPNSASPRDETMPAVVKELLQPYRLPSVWL